MGSFKQGKVLVESLYGCTNKSKTITYRSSWEYKCFIYLQQLAKLKKIKSWSSEETVMRYFYSLDNKFHSYYIDFTVELSDGSIITIEVKPFAETQPPKKPKTFKSERQKQNYNNAVATYIKNTDKWNSTLAWCREENQKLGYEKFKFIIWTERTDKPNNNPIVKPVLDV